MSLESSKVRQMTRNHPFLNLAVVAMDAIESYIPAIWKITAQPNGPYPEGSAKEYEIQLLIKREDATSPSPLMRLEFYADAVRIPSVVLPFELYHQGIIIRTLGQMTDAGAKMGYQVIVEDHVKRYERRLLRRGARPIENLKDSVVLHADMNFEPSSGPTE